MPRNNKTCSSHLKQQGAAVCTVGLHKSQAIYNSSKLNLRYSWSLVTKSVFPLGQSPCFWNISNKVSFSRKAMRHAVINSVEQILLKTMKRLLTPQTPQRMGKHAAETFAWTVCLSSITIHLHVLWTMVACSWLSHCPTWWGATEFYSDKSVIKTDVSEVIHSSFIKLTEIMKSGQLNLLFSHCLPLKSSITLAPSGSLPLVLSALDLIIFLLLFSLYLLFSVTQVSLSLLVPSTRAVE